jgi:hypothetical protein
MRQLPQPVAGVLDAGIAGLPVAPAHKVQLVLEFGRVSHLLLVRRKPASQVVYARAAGRNARKDLSGQTLLLNYVGRQRPANRLSACFGVLVRLLSPYPASAWGTKGIVRLEGGRDEDRTRPAKDDAEPEPEDAKFFLVSCSAFVNYLIEKARKNGSLPT